MIKIEHEILWSLRNESVHFVGGFFSNLKAGRMNICFSERFPKQQSLKNYYFQLDLHV